MNENKFALRIKKETYSRIRILAKQKYTSINHIINLAIEEYCSRDYEKMISSDITSATGCQQAIHQTFTKDSDQNHEKRKD
jgi:hypothetical protein